MATKHTPTGTKKPRATFANFEKFCTQMEDSAIEKNQEIAANHAGDKAFAKEFMDSEQQFEMFSHANICIKKFKRLVCKGSSK